ncbi:hypothetical protein [Halalkalibacter urbisdiaboli]|uniref:hypothetical protein n=1 Tax=Halalkalibacter urbisdiaboli TaxID=1960589 RepID=UPI000B430519|nr:hypothetical protein [Halalkalibacter urbisdiaboli]
MKLIYLLLIIFIILGGCSSPTLIDAIGKKTSIVEVLFEDDNDNVVLFLSEDYTGKPMLVLNTYTMENSRYKYNPGTGGDAQSIDLSGKYEIVRVTSVGNSSFGALWGGVFNYPNAATVSYSLEDKNGNVLYTSNVEITETNIVYEKLSQEIYDKTATLHYKILDDKNNVIVEW